MTTSVKKFSHLQQLLDALFHDCISAEVISEKRACFKEGAQYDFYDFEIPEASEFHFWKEMAKCIWNKPTPANIEALRNSKGWWLKRLTWNGIRFEYTAGQDHPYEIKKIQQLVMKQSK